MFLQQKATCSCSLLYSMAASTPKCKEMCWTLVPLAANCQWHLGHPRRQPDVKPRSLARRADDVDAAAESLNDLLTDRQPQTAAALFSGEKRLKDACLDGFIHAAAAVLDAQPDPAAHAASGRLGAGDARVGR